MADAHHQDHQFAALPLNGITAACDPNRMICYGANRSTNCCVKACNAGSTHEGDRQALACFGAIRRYMWCTSAE
jgi:hypothetical protein